VQAGWGRAVSFNGHCSSATTEERIVAYLTIHRLNSDPDDLLARKHATRTRTGLTVRAELDRGRYPLGIKVSDQQLAAVPIRRHQWHGEWNYSILPQPA
jgi:hypothetical protein